MNYLIQAPATALVVMLLLIVVVKVIWNIFLPYGMLRMKERRPVSCFPLIEVIPLVIAILVAWVTNLDGRLSPSSISIVGFGLVGFSYVHFCLVLLIAGIVERNRVRRSGST